jgi:predicted nucleic acid-binding protein
MEAQALALDREGDDAIVATDDRNAIRACKALRIGFVTSLGILVRSVEKDLLSPEDANRILDRLVIYGRLRKDVVEEARRQIGDTTHGESSKNR